MQRSRRESPRHNSPQVMPSVQSPCKLLATLPSAVNRLQLRPPNSSPHELTDHRYPLLLPHPGQRLIPFFTSSSRYPVVFSFSFFHTNFTTNQYFFYLSIHPPAHLHSF